MLLILDWPIGQAKIYATEDWRIEWRRRRL